MEPVAWLLPDVEEQKLQGNEQEGAPGGSWSEAGSATAQGLCWSSEGPSVTGSYRVWAETPIP